jgi:hypothetical protein
VKQAAAAYLERCEGRHNKERKTGVQCDKCRHAVVGHGELCHCEKGRWANIPLAQVSRIGEWLKCAAFDTMED